MKTAKPPYSYELSPERSSAISLQLYRLMDLDKPFLRRRYSIQELSGHLNIPSYQLSAYFNRVVGCHFNDYINKLRVGHCEELIRQRVADQLNIYGLAFECGFHNRNSFTIAFKKFTGYTPSVYLKKMPVDAT